MELSRLSWSVLFPVVKIRWGILIHILIKFGVFASVFIEDFGWRPVGCNVYTTPVCHVLEELHRFVFPTIVLKLVFIFYHNLTPAGCTILFRLLIYH